MFGYVRPLRDELKVRDWENYRACYCGLCYTLRKRYGYWACMLVRYDATVLACALWQGEVGPTVKRHCPGNPLKRKCTCARSDALDRCADASVLLMVAKLQDEVVDGRRWKKWLAWLMLKLLWRARRKARRALPAVAERLDEMNHRLHALEAEQSRSLDATADTFAAVMAAVPPENQPQSRAWKQLCYHIGRWIYLMDACDDLDKDRREGNYNAVASRFELTDGQMPDEVKTQMAETAGASMAASAAAHALLADNGFSPVLLNVLYLGLPAMQQKVLFCPHPGECHEKEKM